ncbi:MAG: Fe-S cluster assembly protein SufD [Dehalococcoidia bacterium]|nr:Fe-S cluster assembly protein SufD [Dehalococcoidia bacterium]
MTHDVLIAPGFTKITRASAEEISVRRDEPAWLRERRLDAWRLYQSLDFPHESDEEWRRTDVRSMIFDAVRPLSASAPIASPAQLPAALRSAWDESEALAGRVVQQDSDVVYTQLADDLRARGVILTDLHKAAKEHPELVRRYLSSAVPAGEWKYVALNAALWSGGCFLFVPKDVEVALPLQLLTVVGAEGLAVFPRTIIVAEAGSRVAFIDETRSADGETKTFVSGVTEIYAGDGARVEYYSVNRWGHNVYNFNTARAIVGRDAQLVTMAAGIGGKMTKMRIDTSMPEPGASADLLGVTFGDGDQHFDYNTLQDHIGAHTKSDLQFKSAMTDSSSIVWYGITRIEPTASASEANQTSRNLLLSEHAKAAPIPILEIEAYDVLKCSHGATAGPVDENELFYLQARAIPRAVAERMLVEGFLADVVNRIPNAGLRERVMRAVLAKAGATPELGEDDVFEDDVFSDGGFR